jgi:threonine dehydratase
VLDFPGAERAVAGLARRTPLLEAHDVSERIGAPVLVKAECLQVTGSFKVRGAAARLSALTPEERARGVVACSSGNHGRAVAYVAERLGVRATVCVPEWVDPVKLAAIRATGAEAVLAGATFDEAEVHALDLAARDGRPYVSAYDDPWVIAGQGTIALEILDELGEAPAAVLAPLSGGGLVGGIAAALAHRLGEDAPPVVAVSAERAAVMLASLRAGRPVEVPEEETLASALAGGLGPANRYSFPLVRELVREHVTVTEEQIAGAMRYAVRSLRLVVEGGGAVALAALLSGAWPESAPPAGDPPEGPVVVVLSGGNLAPRTLASVLRSA